jgi:endonuclease/exonuclease/phosphatase family metal-dependent hydrolase
VRIVTWNVARRSSRLAEQAAALAAREPDVVALQEITSPTLPLWRAALEMIALRHVRASLDCVDRSRAAANRHRTGVLLGSRTQLADATALPVPWPESAIATVTASAASGPVEIHCLHVPNAANGWVKVRTLEAVRGALASAPPRPRVLCGDLNTPRRELPDYPEVPKATGGDNSDIGAFELQSP